MRAHRTWIVLGVAALAVVVRVVPYVCARFGLLNVHDFSASLLSVAPIGAMCLFGGARLSNRWIGVAVPLAILVGTNLLIGLVMDQFEYYTFYRDQGVVLSGFLLTAALGATIPENATLWRISATAFVAELAFYLITNFAFWILTDWYPQTLGGLWQSYVMALPFFGRSLLGMTVWGSVLFGALALAEKTVPQRAATSV